MNTWSEWWPEYSKVNRYHPIEGYMYDAWNAGFEAGALNAEKEIVHLKSQLLRVGNQQDVLKAAYLAGQMAKPVKTFSGNKPNYVIPQETFDLTESDINKLITEYGLTVVDGDIYAFARGLKHASRTKKP